MPRAASPSPFPPSGLSATRGRRPPHVRLSQARQLGGLCLRLLHRPSLSCLWPASLPTSQHAALLRPVHSSSTSACNVSEGRGSVGEEGGQAGHCDLFRHCLSRCGANCMHSNCEWIGEGVATATLASPSLMRPLLPARAIPSHTSPSFPLIYDHK